MGPAYPEVTLGTGISGFYMLEYMQACFLMDSIRPIFRTSAQSLNQKSGKKVLLRFDSETFSTTAFFGGVGVIETKSRSQAFGNKIDFGAIEETQIFP